MRIVNRTVVVLRPKKPFLEWVLRPPNPAGITAERAREPVQAYFLPPCEEEGDAERFLRRYSREMFEAELESWSLEESSWPAKRDYSTFRRWFDPLVLEVPFDLCDAPLEAEEEG